MNCGGQFTKRNAWSKSFDLTDQFQDFPTGFFSKTFSQAEENETFFPNVFSN